MTPLTVCETFYSIQGESTFAGYPCFFIRLTGCNLRCSYCDTAYAYEEGEILEEAELVERAIRCGARLVEVTGGEPLLQNGTVPLLKSLSGSGFTVLLETNGSQPLGAVPEDVVRIMDLKCPSSGMSGFMDLNNLNYLGMKDQVKFVIQNQADYEWTRDIIGEYQVFERTQIMLSPVWGRMDAGLLAEWMLADRLPARLQIQLHKFIWPDRERMA
ncbi:MAG: radical SAM protein [Pseudomonadota bacterium]